MVENSSKSSRSCKKKKRINNKRKRNSNKQQYWYKTLNKQETYRNLECMYELTEFNSANREHH